MPKQPTKRKRARRRDGALPADYLTVEYFPPSDPIQPTIRAGTREPSAAERELERYEKPATKRKGA